MPGKSAVSQPVIVFGTGRSGTTIISETLFRHPSFAFPSNYHERFPGVQSASLIRHLFDNWIWRYEGKKQQLTKAGWLNRFAFIPGESYAMWDYLCKGEVDFARGFLLEEKLKESTRSEVITFLSTLMQLQRRERLAFKITGPSRMGFLLDLFPEARFIHVSRDPFATIQSWLKVEFWQDKGMHQLWWTGAYSSEEMEWAKQNSQKPHILAAFQYLRMQEVLEMEYRKYRPYFLEVRYEDFVNAPADWARRMIDFAGVNPSPWVSKFLNRNPMVNTNKRPEEYFTDKELEEINEVLNPSK